MLPVHIESWCLWAFAPLCLYAFMPLCLYAFNSLCAKWFLGPPWSPHSSLPPRHAFRDTCAVGGGWVKGVGQRKVDRKEGQRNFKVRYAISNGWAALCSWRPEFWVPMNGYSFAIHKRLYILVFYIGLFYIGVPIHRTQFSVAPLVACYCIDCQGNHQRNQGNPWNHCNHCNQPWLVSFL